MACITLTRTALPLGRGASEVPGWTVAYEGRPVAAYAEGADGRLRQVGSSRLDAALRGPASAWGPAGEYQSRRSPRSLLAAGKRLGIAKGGRKLASELIESPVSCFCPGRHTAATWWSPQRPYHLAC